MFDKRTICFVSGLRTVVTNCSVISRLGNDSQQKFSMEPEEAIAGRAPWVTSWRRASMIVVTPLDFSVSYSHLQYGRTPLLLAVSNRTNITREAVKFSFRLLARGCLHGFFCLSIAQVVWKLNTETGQLKLEQYELKVCENFFSV